MWEYKIVDNLGQTLKDALLELNQLGVDGWELVFMYRQGPSFIEYYFKRPLPTPTPNPRDILGPG